MYLTIVEEFSLKVVQIGFLSGGKFTPVIKYEDASNLMLTLDGIGPFLQNFKNLEPLKIEKMLIHPVEGLLKLFFLKNKKW